MKVIPVILLVSERSGSNLLRSLIGNHKDICAPVSPHLMAEFYNQRRYYGDLRSTDKAGELIKDMVEVANHPYHDWKLNVDLNEITGVNSIVTAVNKLYSLKAKQEGKSHYCSKGIDAFKFIDAYRGELENVKFVHMVRDPRDHVASWMKRPINLLTPFDAVQKWKHEQQLFIDAVSGRGLNCISITYEELITDTKSTMSKVLNFIGVDLDENCFQTDSNNPESKKNPYWQNLSKPVMKDNKEKYLKELSEDDVLIIESVAKCEMEFFRYSLRTKGNWFPPTNYNRTLNKLRLIRSKSLSVNKDMTELKSKWQLINRIKKSRYQEWQRTSHDHRFSLISTSSPRQRFKFLLYALLGENISASLKRKFK